MKKGNKFLKKDYKKERNTGQGEKIRLRKIQNRQDRMKNKLVIVESPAKAKTIGKILGNGYTIKASMGHVRDLPQRSLGVDIEHNFAPQYEENRERSKNLNDLKSAAKGAAEIYLAPDPDREGEAIAWHLKDMLSKDNKSAVFRRVTFHEITASAIRKAFESPADIDLDRVDAQQARRVLDRIVGYMVSPLLWGRIEKGLSAGRVQSVALRLVCEREREILSFVPKEYWNFSAKFHAEGTKEMYSARLFKIDGEKFEISSSAEADKLLAAVRASSSWKIANVEETPRKRFAQPPFITSTLQQAASSSLGFSANSTMRIAQQLYEGLDIGNGTTRGLITYMRTDAVAVATEAQQAARKYIEENYGAEYVPAKPNIYRSKASAQGAHEAIRPTDITLTPEKLKGVLDTQQLKLYTLIWKRFTASQMAPCEQMRTSVDTQSISPEDSRLYTFRSTATVTTFAGFLRAYNIQEEGAASEEDEDTKDAEVLKNLKNGMTSILADSTGEQKFTEPAPRFSEATLIKELESNGIGRPSTYATIVNTIQVRKYVNKEKGKLIPTELGFKINDYLVAKLPELFQVGFTADMENQLDSVEEGKVVWTEMMQEFYDKFLKWLSAAKTEGAPEGEKAKALIELLNSIKEWQKAEKTGTRTYDDKRFFSSVLKAFESGKTITAKQWEALLRLAVKYEEQLSALAEIAEKCNFTEELASTRQIALERTEKAAEAKKQLKDASVQAEISKYQSLFSIMDVIKWDVPEKRNAFDEKKFYNSLKTQNSQGKLLSIKQLSVLSRLAIKYKAQFSAEDYAKITEILNLPAEEPSSATTEKTDPEILFKKFESVKEWAEPRKIGRMVYDDKAFYESLLKQHKAKKELSAKQLAALQKLAGKYSLN